MNKPKIQDSTTPSILTIFIEKSNNLELIRTNFNRCVTHVVNAFTDLIRQINKGIVTKVFIMNTHIGNFKRSAVVQEKNSFHNSHRFSGFQI